MSNALELLEMKKTLQSPTIIFSYFCTVCGALCFICKHPLRNVYQRKDDKAYAIDEVKTLLKKYLTADKEVIIKKPSGYEKQWRLKCNNCGMIVGYQARPFEEELAIKSGLPPVLYIYGDHVIGNNNQCMLIKELAKMSSFQ